MKRELVGYTSSLETFEEFFIRCGEAGVGEHDAAKMSKDEFLARRISIWEDLVKELRAIRLNEKDIKRVIKDKKVGRIGFKKGKSDEQL